MSFEDTSRRRLLVRSAGRAGAAPGPAATVGIAAEGRSIGFDRSSRPAPFAITRERRAALEMRLRAVGER